MEEERYLKLRDLLNSFFKLNSSVTVDNLIHIVVPLSYIELVNRERPFNDNHSELYFLSSKKTKDDFFGINKQIEDSIHELNSDEIKDLVTLALDKNYGAKGSADSTITTSSLADLAYRLLHFKNGDSFYDLGSGDGSTLANIARLAQNDNVKLKHLYGQETNQSLIGLSRISVGVFANDHTDVSIKYEDAIEPKTFKYNKAYAYAPVGTHNTLKSENYKSLLYPDIELNEAFHEQWVYIDRMLANLEGDDARAVALVFSKTLNQTKSNAYLQRLLDDGWIEGIIELPMNSLNNSGAYCYFIVFSKYNSGTVRSIWADDINFSSFKLDFNEATNRRYFINVDGIMNLYEGKIAGKKSRDVTYEQLKVLNCWWPTSEPLLTSEEKKGKYVPLEDLAYVFTSTQDTLAFFGIAEGKTDYRVLTSREIENYGIKWDEVKYVNNNNFKLDKFLIQNGDVIITNKSTKVKIVVVKDKPDEKIISIGGNIVVRPHEGELDPTYLKMFLESKEGQDLLNMASTGSTMIHFSTSMIMNMGIPYLDYDKQVKKANKYNACLDRINAYYEEIKELNSEMKKVFISREDE